MAKSVFILSTEADSGKFIVSLGLMNGLSKKYRKTAYFKPVISQYKRGETDSDIKTIIHFFSRSSKPTDHFAVSGHRSGGEGADHGELLDTVIAKYKDIEKDSDWIIVQGTDYSNPAGPFELGFNIEIAKNIGSPVLLVIKGDNKSGSEILAEANEVSRQLANNAIALTGIVVNKAPLSLRKTLVNDLKSRFECYTSVIPAIKELNDPVLYEVLYAVNGKLINDESDLFQPVTEIVVKAAYETGFLKRLQANSLLITSTGRADLIAIGLLSRQSSDFAHLAGIVLSAEKKLDFRIMNMIRKSDLPIILSNENIVDIVRAIDHIKSRVSFEKQHKIMLAVKTFDKFVNLAILTQKIKNVHTQEITSHMFQYQLIQRARKFKARIVMPEGEDERILKAAARIISLGLGEITLMGDVQKIAALIKTKQIGLDIDKLIIVDPVNDKEFENYSAKLYELRKNTGLSYDNASVLMTDPSYFGAMMVYTGRADAMVSGAVYTTRQTVKPALEFIKAKNGSQLVSSVFFMCLPQRVVIFGDCAINPNPTTEQLAEIAISSAETAQLFGITPKIAMISYSSGKSGVGSEVEKVRRATEIVRNIRHDLDIEGPIQYDAAVNPVIARAKLPGSKVAGHANILIFPNLNTGNAIYKAVQQETGAMAIGPILQNLKKPVNDLSRGATVDDIFNTILITLIQCADNASAPDQLLKTADNLANLIA